MQMRWPLPQIDKHERWVSSKLSLHNLQSLAFTSRSTHLHTARDFRSHYRYLLDAHASVLQLWPTT